MNYFDYYIKAIGQVQVSWNATEQALWLVTNGTPRCRSWHSAIRNTCTRWMQKVNPQLYFLLEIILYCCRRKTTGQAKQRHFLSFSRPVMTTQSEHTHLKFPVKQSFAHPAKSLSIWHHKAWLQGMFSCHNGKIRDEIGLYGEKFAVMRMNLLCKLSD